MAGKLGFPAVSTPRTASRDVQDSVANIRARLETIEALLKSTNLTAQAASFAASTGSSSSTTTTPTTPTYYATVAMLASIAVAQSSPTSVSPLDPSNTSTVFGYIGVTTAPAAAGAQVSVAASGVVSVNATLTPGLPVFAGVGGVLTQSPSQSFPFYQMVGVAITANTMLVTITPPVVNSQFFLAAPGIFLPASEAGGGSFQLNGQLVGIRPILDIVVAGGITITAVDDPAGNRVIYTFGQNVVVIPTTQNVEDVFTWDYEEPEDDTAWWGIDDVAQGNNSIRVAWLIDDGDWDWSYDEPEDISWIPEITQQTVVNLSDIVREDPWIWDTDPEPDDETTWTEFSDYYLPPYPAPDPVHLHDEYWDWGYEEPEEDSWWLGYDDGVIGRLLAPRFGPEDNWDWEEEIFDEWLWAIDDTAQWQPFVVFPANALEDAWPWYEQDDVPTEPSEVWESDSGALQVQIYQTLALLHFDGINGLATCHDEISANSWTMHDQGVLDTSLKDFGTASMNCNWSAGGNDGYVDESTSTAPGGKLYGLLQLANLTIEGFYYPLSYGSGRYLFTKGDNGGAGTAEFFLEVNNVGQLIFIAYDTALTTRVNLSGGTLTLNQWNHLGVSKSGSNWYLFLNGSVVATGSATPSGWSYPSGSGVFGVGRNGINAPGNNYYYDFDGHIDEFRVSQVARYTGAYTVPTQAFTVD